jgi:hypothetical protein
LALLLLAAPAAAQQAGQFGAGMGLGDPTGASGKYFLTDRAAVDFGLGVSDTLVLWTDYVYHDWDLLPQPKKGTLGVYGAVGGRFESQFYPTFALRGMLGLSYWPRFKHPVELFLELGPAVRVTDDNSVRVRTDGMFGARWYFRVTKLVK